MKNDDKNSTDNYKYIADVYELKHTEIYNPIEQTRLKTVIKKLLNHLKQQDVKVLDFGAGTGNLTLKFLQAGCRVTAADISEKSIQILQKRANHPNLTTKRFDGGDLPFDNEMFDIVGTYSVLHHIPDYLHAIREMIRVAKPGGLIYIDHEANENKWNPDDNLQAYHALTRQTRFEHIKSLIKTRELFTREFLKCVWMKAFVDKRYEREGDIHVWKDDHIEWPKIVDLIRANNCEIIENTDYLLYRPKGGTALYEKYKHLTSDTKSIIFLKPTT
jgi:ubiquinone/menaquinone biosynthesis C-methylase UbiE